jgi:hypothetical protein
MLTASRIGATGAGLGTKHGLRLISDPHSFRLDTISGGFIGDSPFLFVKTMESCRGR